MVGGPHGGDRTGSMVAEPRDQNDAAHKDHTGIVTAEPYGRDRVEMSW